jgi:hypothetical protein
MIPTSNSVDRGTANPTARGFYSEAKDTIDIAVIGNSDAYSGFSRWSFGMQKAIPHMSAGEGWQNTSGAYQMLKELLSCQTPKVVLLETDELFAKFSTIDATFDGTQRRAAGSSVLP